VGYREKRFLRKSLTVFRTYEYNCVKTPYSSCLACTGQSLLNPNRKRSYYNTKPTYYNKSVSKVLKNHSHTAIPGRVHKSGGITMGPAVEL
jgi:hypothetical protein